MSKTLSLSDPVTELKFISEKYAKLLGKLGIFTIRDLLTHFPRYHTDQSQINNIGDIALPGRYVLKGYITNFRNVFTRNRKQLQSAKLTDQTGSINVTWFNQPYLQNVFKHDSEVILSGKVNLKGNQLQLVSPQYDLVKTGQENVNLGVIAPTYRLTSGVSIKWLRRRIKELLTGYQLTLSSPLDSELESRIEEAVKSIHFPRSENDIEQAEKRLSIEELSSIMLQVMIRKDDTKADVAPTINFTQELHDKFLESLDFELTTDQHSVIRELMADLSRPSPMLRLIQGDVGSGKTVVAIAAALQITHSGFQVAILTPTTVLAKQHYSTVTKLLTNINAKAALVTGRSERNHNDDTKVFIGTTAILARKKNLFDNLGLIIVDEQHKFGVKQRHELQEFIDAQQLKPHLLDMTATPIPRTIALTFFADLEVSSIKTKPSGRIPINTRIIPQRKRKDSYSWINEQIDDGRQIYWVCPLVEESETLEIKSAKETFKLLSTEIFEHRNIGLLHGKMKEGEKIEQMEKFKSGEIDILVSTTVIEVGIDVGNATVMIIEDADRLGLAQLHQLRGRVGRSSIQSWCFVYESQEISEVGKDRLRFFATHRDGLEIAEYDLQLRGPGEVYGTRQSGIPNLKIAKLDDQEIIQTSQKLAAKLFERGVREIPLFPS